MHKETKLSKKALLADILMKSGGIWLIRQINRLLKKKLLVLAYHRVYNIDDKTNFSSDPELISASIDQFSWQIDYLRRHYTVVTFRQYHQMPLKDRFCKNIVVITFDDGFKDNFDTAFPILKKNKIPAVFYISVDYIGTDNRFWFEYLVSVILQTPDSQLSGLCATIKVDQSENRTAIVKSALGHLKNVTDTDRLGILKTIYEFDKLNNILTETDAYPMSWDNIIEMHRSGMEIGSHTLTHPILTNTDKEQCVREIAQSKKKIDAVLNSSCVSISYPNGQEGEFDNSIIDIVKGSGYQYACSYISGVNNHLTTEKYDLKRIHVERYTSNSYFAASLALPSLFA